MKCKHICVDQKAYELSTELQIEPDFPSLADEIAEPRPDMNIKVASFTVSEKSSNIHDKKMCTFRDLVNGVPRRLQNCIHRLLKSMKSSAAYSCYHY